VTTDPYKLTETKATVPFICSLAAEMTNLFQSDSVDVTTMSRVSVN